MNFSLMALGFGVPAPGSMLLFGNMSEPTPGFSLELSSDLREMRDWVHEFAAQVIRPAAAEWDEREQTPWPILQEAAKVGLYSLDFFATQFFEESGLGIPVAYEELFWGDAGIGLSLVGSTLAAVSVVSNGTPEQIGEWCPQMFGDGADVKLGAFCSSEPDAGSDVAAIRTRAVYDEAKDEWAINGVKTWATNGGIANVHVVVASVDPSLGSRGQATFIVPPGAKGLSQGQKFKKHGVRASHTAEVILDDVRVPGRCLVGGKEKLDRRLARVREGGRGGEQAAMKTFEASRPSVAAMAVGVGPGRRRVRDGVRGDARAVRQADRRQPGRRLPACRHGRRRGRGPAADLARGVDGAPRQAVRARGGLDVQAGRGRDGRPRDRAGDPDPRRQRLHPRLPGRALAPRRQDLHDLRGHVEIQRMLIGRAVTGLDVR